MEIPQKIKINLPYDPAISFFGIYPKEMKSAYERIACTLVLIAVQLTIANIWNQPRCPSADGQTYPPIHTHTHTHTHIPIYQMYISMMKYYLVLKK